MEFCRLVTKQTIPWDEYMRQAKIVLDLFPEPFGPPWDKKGLDGPIPPPTRESKAPKKKRKKRTVTCGICGEQGHNARGCSNKPDAPTVKHTDGIERLAPGFDPNPPG